MVSRDELNQIEAETWTERRLQQSFIADALSLRIRLCYHTWDSRHSAAGFPDLIMLHGGRGLAVELKSERGKIRDEQAEWLHAFALLPGMRSYTFRPHDYLSGRCLEAMLWLVGRE